MPASNRPSTSFSGHAQRGKRVTVREKRLGGALPSVPYAILPRSIRLLMKPPLSNAIDASNEGGTVTIRTTRSAEQNGQNWPVFCIEVADQGTGNRGPAVRQRDFSNPVSFTTKAYRQRGQALGPQPSVYGIVQEPRPGRFEVESTVGKGLDLPCQSPPWRRPRPKSENTK